MIEYKNISKKYPNGKMAVRDVNMKFDKGEFVCFIGTSGSGKTTLMRMLNRMLEPTSGEITISGKNIKDYNEVELRRKIGYVIQQIGLMPHMTIYENITMVPKLLKWPEERRRQVAQELIKMVELPESFLERYPSELSGGQQQRIGVIRALAADQDVVLMDEPFGALDPLTRESLQSTVKRLQQQMGKTFVFVTHDMDEAIKLADKIAIMDKGELIQFDTVDNILMNPANDFVRNMIGEDRLSEAQFNMDTVEHIMMKSPIKVNVNSTLRTAVNMMHNNRVDTLFVVDDNDVLLGALDVFALRGEKRLLTTPISDLLKRANAISNTTKVKDALYYINELQYRNLPVIDHEGKLVGLITRATMMDCLYDNFWSGYEPEENEVVITDGYVMEDHKNTEPKVDLSFLKNDKKIENNENLSEDNSNVRVVNKSEEEVR
ncbi:betaine/proline/choline family ABC transporter ATP-binding protein [Peptostreptococcus sp. CBA3647]|uniref:ABC transporter ATP-binding protein n=1 Tax=Peptostreptococcus equinus TaxID=3003601 RepID=UPI0022B03C4C|nr:betaine/proline/choline family ABC transporter ATP-binding protein [Peptostreptococcus sp. CBA3647]